MQTYRPRKRFGQHFLHDPGVITRIVAAIAPQPGDTLVEIGPGLGALSLPLLQTHSRLQVIELDRDVIPRLEARCRNAGKLDIIQADALQVDFSRFYHEANRLRLVGNLPYNISTPLLFHLLEFAPLITDMHFMLQREVVERMSAKPGSKAYGRLTVMLAVHCKVEALFRVAPGAFSPPPAVESAVVRLIPHAEPPFPVADPAGFAKVVTQAFSQRRKTLRNALKTLLSEATISAAGLDPGVRPEMVPPDGFARLAARLEKG